MKAGIISDTHGLLREEVKEILSQCQIVIHGGDIHDETVFQQLKEYETLYIVKGNNDKGVWSQELKEDITFEILGLRIYLTHDKKHVSKEMAGQSDVIIFGHSHQYFCKEQDGVLWLNPGSCGKKRFHLPLTMAIMEIQDNKHFSVKKIDIE